MKQHTFTLKKGGKEFPDRFGGQELTYSYPDTLEEVYALIPDPLPEGITREAIILSKILGQGIHLDIQKDGKDALNDEAVAQMDVAGGLAYAQNQMTTYRLPVPGTKRGEGKAGKVAKAEARATKAEQDAEAAKQELREAYSLLPRNARAKFAANLVARGVFTQEEIAALDAA